MLRAFEWRPIGPHRGGRVSAVAAHAADPRTFYFGAAAGGVWKTDNGGIDWMNVSDGFFETPAVGALAVAPPDPRVLYAGTGEANIRTDVVHGSGVYRSPDGGATWSRRGLADSRHISRLVVHPENPNVVYAAALGHIYSPGGERGVYRTRDGGASWKLVLAGASHAGAIDLAMDPHDPNRLYAALWEVRRTPYRLESGGPGSGLYVTTDGGDHWRDLSRMPGMPAGPLGRMGIALSARAGRVWVQVEAADGGLHRSDDGGLSWVRVNRDAALALRPWYFSRLAADPVDPDALWALNLNLWRSKDGGSSFQMVPTPHVDHHDLWIDPGNPRRLVNGHDGGATVSFDGGASWSSTMNQPTAQFYHVTTDRQIPYRVYGAQQDSTTISVPSRTDGPGITLGDCYTVGGGESGYIAVNPHNPNIVYAGSNGSILTRYDHATGQTRVVTPWPEEVRGSAGRDLTYRFAWTFPVTISPHDPRTVYVGAHVLFRSTNEGQDWEVVSPDLTRHDPDTLGPSGGPITGDNGHAELYATLATVAESPLEAGVIWTGSDDGKVYITRDGGATWRDATPANLPDWALIATVEPSPHQAGTAYVAATRYKLDDLRPYVLKTADYGQTWSAIATGIRPNDFARVIREDPVRPGLLFLGTESGVYVSIDDGAHWREFRQNLPVVPVYDLVVHDGDLVAATHGRSFWIADDITALRACAFEGAVAELPTPPSVVRSRARGQGQFPPRASGYASAGTTVVHWHRRGGDAVACDAGLNPPSGATVTFILPDAPKAPPTLIIRDESGILLKDFSAEIKDVGAGIHRVVWDMRYPGATPLPGAVYRGGSGRGPVAPPGEYQLTLAVDGQELSSTVRIVPDPRLQLSLADYHTQFQFLRTLTATLSRLNETVIEVRRLRDALSRVAGSGSGAAAETRSIRADLDQIEESLIQPRAQVPLDYLKYPPGVNVKLAALMNAVDGADGIPTSGAASLAKKLTQAVDEAAEHLAELVHARIRAAWPEVLTARTPSAP